MVRLKVVGAAVDTIRSVYFNSTMVRLKVVKAGILQSSEVLFQFHYGSVKSICTFFFINLVLSISIPLWFG